MAVRSRAISRCTGAATGATTLAGVLWVMRGRESRCRPFTLRLRGDVPLGAGLSSSASVEVATAMALLASCGRNASRRGDRHAVPQRGERFCGRQLRHHGPICDRLRARRPRAAAGLPFARVRGPAASAIGQDCDLQLHGEAHGGAWGVRRPQRRGDGGAGRHRARAHPGSGSLRDATLADLEACRA